MTNENVNIYEENPIYKKLVNFRDQIKSPTKSGNSLTCDSTMWYMEALMNASNSNPDSAHSKIIYDTAYFSIQLDSEGNVPIDLVSTTYYEMKDTILQRLAELESESKHFWGADFQILSNRGNLDFMIVFAMGFNIPWSYDPFTDEDDWIFGHTEGYCETGAPPYSDGGEELQWRLNHPYFAIGGVGAIISVMYDTRFGYDYPDIIYYEFVPGDLEYPCMEHGELTDRLWLAHHVFYYREINGGWLPDDDTWTFEFVDIKALEREVTTPEAGWEYYHYYIYTFAQREEIIIHD